MLEGKTLLEAKKIVERISGNESIAYQIAFRDIILKATNSTLPLELRKYHAFLLELERMAHHLTDLGFIPNDAGFGAALAFASKMAEDVREFLKSLTNHRFGFGSVEFKKPKFDKSSIYKFLDKLEDEVKFFEDWIIDIPSLWDRLDTTGKLPLKKAIKYDCVGVVARASGASIDKRLDKFYIENGFELQNEVSGDVAARFKVRLNEVKNSIKMCRNFIVEDELSLELGNINDSEYMGYAESSLGEVFLYVDIKDGVIDRFFARDPSFVNWQALHIMMDGNIIADFPLINKSCDLSYAGNDL